MFRRTRPVLRCTEPTLQPNAAMVPTTQTISIAPERVLTAPYSTELHNTETSIINIRAAASSPVPHSTYVIQFPFELPMFSTYSNINIALPITYMSFPTTGSLIEIAHYLSVLAWSPWIHKPIRTECLALLGNLARLAKVIHLVVQDDCTRNFLTLLGSLGRKVFLRTGECALLCGLTRSMMAIIMQGEVRRLVHQDAVLFSTRVPEFEEMHYLGRASSSS